MKIYCTNWNKLKDVNQLYKEWTGQEPDFNRCVTTNIQLVVAKDEESNKIVGVLQWRLICDPIWSRSWALVENVYVAKACRNNGVATKLMKFAEEDAKYHKCQFVKLTSSKKMGQALYRFLGYKEGASFRKEL